jgi:cytochrome c oxidase subunit 2
MQVEIVGSQFKWEFRYPGEDKVLGKKYYREISGEKNNPMGQIWDDQHNHDDVYVSGEAMHLIVNKPVKLVIGSKDVIHDVGLAHFRLKMDAVPGTPTTMWFTPTITTKDMIKETGNPAFVYEISCDQMCGKGHTNMRGEIIVETQAEFDAWMATKKPQYLAAFPPKTTATDTLKAPGAVVDSLAKPTAATGTGH